MMNLFKKKKVLKTEQDIREAGNELSHKLIKVIEKHAEEVTGDKKSMDIMVLIGLVNIMQENFSGMDGLESSLGMDDLFKKSKKGKIESDQTKPNYIG